MSAADFDLPAALEALLCQVCGERGLPARQYDAIRTLVSLPESRWPRCCRAQCEPCVEDHARIAREILGRWGRPV